MKEFENRKEVVEPRNLTRCNCQSLIFCLSRRTRDIMLFLGLLGNERALKEGAKTSNGALGI